MTAPVEPGSVGDAPAPVVPAPSPTPTPAPVPTPFDPNTLSPEVKAYLAQQRAEIESKARTGSKENAAKEARDLISKQIAEALGLKPADVDPAAVAADLAKEREANRRLVVERAIDRATRTVGGDEDLVAAWLSHKGLLRDLDPSKSTFDADVAALVAAQIEANPKLKGAPAASSPAAPGGRDPVGAFNGAPPARRAGSLHEALLAQNNKQ